MKKVVLLGLLVAVLWLLAQSELNSRTRGYYLGCAAAFVPLMGTGSWNSNLKSVMNSYISRAIEKDKEDGEILTKDVALKHSIAIARGWASSSDGEEKFSEFITEKMKRCANT